MSPIVVRKALPYDAHDIATVHVLTWQCVYRGQIPDSYLDELSIEKRTQTWKKQIESQEAGIHTIVAEVEGKVVGWCTVGKNRDEAVDSETGELMGIYVHPNYIGVGCGSKLMKVALRLLREDGFKKATLWVLDTNERTIKWYESKGWKIEGSKKIEKREDFELKETRYIISL